MNFNVTNIQITSNDTVNFFVGSDVVMNVSRVAQSTSPYILRNGNNIVIIQNARGNDFQLANGTMANDHFQFSTINITQVGSKAYTPVNQNIQNASAANETRAKAIYTDLVTNIFSGCCSCSDCSGGCPITYQYNSDIGTGQFYEVSGKILLSFDSYNGADFSGFFHNIPNDSWITFYNQDDPTTFFIYEITNYVVISGLATWDYVLINSQGVYTEDSIYCLDIKPALSAGGGGSQSFQQTLDVDPDVDKHNTVSGSLSYDFYWDKFNKYGIYAKKNLFLKTPKVIGAISAAGYPLTLQNLADGDADFNQLDTIGIKDGAVTYDKIQSVNADSVLGRGATSGVVQELSCTSAGRDIIAAANATAQRALLGTKQSIALAGGNVGGTIAAGVTSYLAPTVDAAPGGTEANRASILSFSGTLKDFYYLTLGAQPATGSFVLTIRKATGMGAFASTSVVITVAAGSAAGIFSDVVNTASFSAGDRCSIQITNNASSVSAVIGTWMAIIEQTY